jgi:FMN phosphatase YigB (HAD superfamily)
MKDKVILVDCDGVLLDWEYAFDMWMTHHGHQMTEGGWNSYKIGERYGIQDGKKMIRHFNESAAIGFLPPLRDAIHYVKKLHEEHGFIFHAITSLSNDQNAQTLRTSNLKRLFGETVFEKFVYLDTGADKDDALLPYKGTGCYWVEDKYTNVDLGISLGLTGILVAHSHNVEYNGSATRVQNWKEIYNIITGV